MTGDAPRPPRLGRLLVRLAPLGERRADVEADLEEQFMIRARTTGVRVAAWRYVRDAASLWLIRPSGQAAGRAARRRSGAGVLDRTWHDLRFATRLARRQWPSLSVAVAGLAVAMGLATAVVSIVNGWQFRDNGVADPDGLLTVRRTQPTAAGAGFQIIPALTYGEFVRLSAGVHAALLVASTRTTVQIEGQPERAVADAVSAGHLRLMGATPHLGRAELDPGPGSADVLLSYGYWRAAFGGDRAVLGRTMQLNGRAVVVAGILARGFSGPGVSGPALWMPLELTADPAWARSTADPRSRNVVVHARLAEGRSLAQAEAQLASLGNGLWPDEAASGMPSVAFLPPFESNSGGFGRPEVVIALAVAGLVVVLACGNVTTILLGVGAARRHEVAVRRALGASRRRLLRQWLTESLALGLAGSGAGLVLAQWLVPLLARQARFAPQLDIWPDGRVFAITALIGAVGGLAAGLSPARHGLRPDLLAALPGSSGHAIADRRGSGTLVLQATLAVVLLTLTMLFARSALFTARLDFGIDTERLLTVQAPAPALGPAGGEFWQTALRRANDEPGVEAAALSARLPLGSSTRSFEYVERGRVVPAAYYETSSQYFETVGLQIVKGRGFTDAEVLAGESVAVVSARLATRLWGEADPIGQRLRQVRAGGDVRVVIGVVEDSVPHYIWRYDDASVHVPLPPATRPVALVVRARGDARAVADRVRVAVHEVEPTASVLVSFVGSEANRQREVARRPFKLSLVASSVALLLAIAGVYAVANFAVRQRRREIGIRLSLGATGFQLWRDVLGPGTRSLAIGIGAGIAGSFIAGYAVRAALIGVEPYDLSALLLTIATLATAATVGSVGPLFRAQRIDPATELRQP